MRNFVYWTTCRWIADEVDQNPDNNISTPGICFLSTAATLHEITCIGNFPQICYRKVHTLNNELTY